MKRVARGFEDPVGVTHAPGDDRLFVVEKPGRIQAVKDGKAQPFLNIEKVVNASSSERGLLSVAFHPKFDENGKLYVDYTNRDGDIVVSEFTAKNGEADPRSERKLMTIPHPGASNHNGGQLAFGKDGMLYVGTGDGGGAGDRRGNAQNGENLLGKVLRIDPDKRTGNLPYGVPDDNPFAAKGDGVRDEVWALGLRNPWRFSFDRSSGELWIGDVGQSAREEIDRLGPKDGGRNFGWNHLEGSKEYEPGSPKATPIRHGTGAGPVHEYGRDGGFSVIGGVVYRGEDLPQLKGKYLFSDFGAQEVRVLPGGDGRQTDFQTIPASESAITSFGEDARGEVYVTTYGGNVYKLGAPGADRGEVSRR